MRKKFKFSNISSICLLIVAKEHTFLAVDDGNERILDDHTPVVKTLVLKEGAQVMLLKNIKISDGLVNGARGVVTSFSSTG